MNEALISFKTAKLAKEKGFSWKNIEYTNNAGSIGYRQCYNYKGQLILPKIYNPNNVHYPACNQSLLQKWFREVHNIHIELIIKGWEDENCISEDLYYRAFIWKVGSSKPKVHEDLGVAKYEVILEIALQEVLKLIKT